MHDRTSRRGLQLDVDQGGHVPQDHGEKDAAMILYDVVALWMTITTTARANHDHNGMVFAPNDSAPILRCIETLARQGDPEAAGNR